MLITAFGGWNDAGDAATSAVRYLVDDWGATLAATIDSDDFYDFTQVRPTTTIDASGQRSIDWPMPKLFVAEQALHTAPTDNGLSEVMPSEAVMLIGIEPQQRWQAFCDEVIDLACSLDVSRVIHLGALLAEVPHSRPAPVTVSGNEAPRVDRSTRYQGPTGIVGVLHQACEAADLDVTSLWAAVPTYVSGTSSPKASLALVRQVSTLLNRPVATGLLEITVDAYEIEISQLVADDDDTIDYVKRLESDYDAGNHLDHTVGLTDEIEQFLRDNPS